MVAKKGKKVKWGIHINKKKVSIFFWAFFGLWFIGFLLYSNIKIFEKRTDLNKDLKELDATMESLNSEKDSLKYSLGQATSDDYLERVAREDLGMQKSGEQVIVIKKGGNDGGSDSSQGNGILKIISGWIEWIKGRF